MTQIGVKLQHHKRTRNLVLLIGLLLVFSGWYAKQMALVLVGLALLNGYGLSLMAMDKRASQRGRFRIPEASMLLLAALGGATGVLASMLLFRHKTKHASFIYTVPLFFAIQVAAVLCFL